MANSWRQIQRQNFTSWGALALFLELDPLLGLPNPPFPLNLPRRLAEKIEKNQPNDPILLQFVPQQEEQAVTAGFVSDPVQDLRFRKEPKLLQKYQGRALLVTTSACAMHCRYCFRKNFSYETSRKDFSQEIASIAQDSSLKEVILSGGDPLSLADETLQDLLQKISSLSHIERIRFHTRFPIGIPERIDASFLQMLEKTTKQVFFVIHANHPKELDQDVLLALKQIQRLGIPVLNQSVLLRGVNDNIETLQTLCETLINHGILPYYLHQLDKVEGAAHFSVEKTKGKELIQELTKRLSGYGIPKYVAEIAGETSKTPL